jgi:ketosteroid isomerase-like protein
MDATSPSSADFGREAMSKGAVMGAKENLQIIEEMQGAARNGDWTLYGKHLADDVTFRMAGVPRSLGGVSQGRDAVLEMMRQNAETTGGTFEQKDVSADDTHVCVVGKISGPRFPGNAFLKSAENPYSTYECVVYRMHNGRVIESTAYVNWLDVYTKVGLVDPTSLLP